MAADRLMPHRLLAIIVLALVGVSPALADWKRDYVLGERAARDGNWAEAEALFRSAARDEPEPSERKRFEGVVFREYAPHFWAGLSAARQGACDRAVDYWQDRSNDVATLAKIRDFKAQQDRGLSDCRQQLAQTQPAPKPVTPIPAPPVATTTPRPITTRPAPADPRPQVPVQVAPKPAPPKPQPAPIAATAPQVLRSAVDAWLAGRVDAVLATRPEQEADGRAKAHLHLLRAAARYVKAQLGDQANLDAARDDIRAARRAMASISPDEAFFSPRFRSFWQQTR